MKHWALLFCFLLLTCGRADRPFEAEVPPGYGPVCGEAGLIGIKLDPITSTRSSQCGIREPVQLYAAGGVRVSGRPILNCRTAKVFDEWIEEEASPAVERYLDTDIREVKVVASYACRTRNNRPGARISEHGKGNGVDVGGFQLEDGQSISVLRDWGKGDKGRALKRMRRKACGRFGVVLGPGSDRYHDDHFHFDTSRYRYCR